MVYKVRTRILVCYLCIKFERKLTRAKYTYILLLAAYSKMYFNIKTNHSMKKETKNRNQKKKKKEGHLVPVGNTNRDSMSLLENRL